MTDTQNKSSNAADLEDAIPMKRMKPAYLAIAGGGLLVVIGLIAFAMHGSSKDQAEVQKLQQQAGPQLTPEQAQEKRDELKEHLKITQGALQKVAAEEKTEKAAADAKKAQDEQQKQEEEQKQAAEKAAAAHAAHAAHVKHSLDNLDNYASQLK